MKNFKKSKKSIFAWFSKRFKEKLINHNLSVKQKTFTLQEVPMSHLIYYLKLYGEKVDIIRPIDDVISPSNANYLKSRDLIIESVGDPNLIK